MIVLGIETSCDETAAAVVEDGRWVRSSVVAASTDLQSEFGGVVPELASRCHLKWIRPVLRRALRDAGVPLQEIGLIAVTQGPGLVGALMVGVSLSKGLALGLGIPLIGVQHLQAHLYAPCLGSKDPSRFFPAVGLLVSGGHTCLLLMNNPAEARILGQTRDDAAGEAFDKVAQALGLGYPGGPAVEACAAEGNASAYAFPRARVRGRPLDFSFSGLKTAVLYELRDRWGIPLGPGRADPELRRKIANQDRADLCASFQEVVVQTLISQTLEACERARVRTLLVGGGVAANGRLRECLDAAAAEHGLQLFVSERRYCIDNAAMIAGLGYALYRSGKGAGLDMSPDPRMPFFGLEPGSI
ncbi:MAG: tRNA (adenosine(37)-N6)-threonylcarbamoyltransferase complex transferase subunit TsaD [Candidatus Omnitrophica bacterium]|nr:tRNA (adenosine(37)-N6)-threonylcarbamoyltransferase complex transferase subunit TsaD [Candidatus Omnitrophota bacterium]